MAAEVEGHPHMVACAEPRREKRTEVQSDHAGANRQGDDAVVGEGNTKTRVEEGGTDDKRKEDRVAEDKNHEEVEEDTPCDDEEVDAWHVGPWNEEEDHDGVVHTPGASLRILGVAEEEAVRSDLEGDRLPVLPSPNERWFLRLLALPW